MTQRKNHNGNSVATWAINLAKRHNPETYDTSIGHAMAKAIAAKVKADWTNIRV